MILYPGAEATSRDVGRKARARMGRAARASPQAPAARQDRALGADTLPKTNKNATRPSLRSNLSPPDSGRLKWCLRFDP